MGRQWTSVELSTLAATRDCVQYVIKSSTSNPIKARSGRPGTAHGNGAGGASRVGRKVQPKSFVESKRSRDGPGRASGEPRGSTVSFNGSNWSVNEMGRRMSKMSNSPRHGNGAFVTRSGGGVNDHQLAHGGSGVNGGSNGADSAADTESPLGTALLQNALVKLGQYLSLPGDFSEAVWEEVVLGMDEVLDKGKTGWSALWGLLSHDQRGVRVAACRLVLTLVGSKEGSEDLVAGRQELADSLARAQNGFTFGAIRVFAVSQRFADIHSGLQRTIEAELPATKASGSSTDLIAFLRTLVSLHGECWVQDGMRRYWCYPPWSPLGPGDTPDPRDHMLGFQLSEEGPIGPANFVPSKEFSLLPVLSSAAQAAQAVDSTSPRAPAKRASSPQPPRPNSRASTRSATRARTVSNVSSMAVYERNRAASGAAEGPRVRGLKRSGSGWGESMVMKGAAESVNTGAGGSSEQYGTLDGKMSRLTRTFSKSVEATAPLDFHVASVLPLQLGPGPLAAHKWRSQATRRRLLSQISESPLLSAFPLDASEPAARLSVRTGPIITPRGVKVVSSSGMKMKKVNAGKVGATAGAMWRDGGAETGTSEPVHPRAVLNLGDPAKWSRKTKAKQAKFASRTTASLLRGGDNVRGHVEDEDEEDRYLVGKAKRGTPIRPLDAGPPAGMAGKKSKPGEGKGSGDGPGGAGKVHVYVSSYREGKGGEDGAEESDAGDLGPTATLLSFQRLLIGASGDDSGSLGEGLSAWDKIAPKSEDSQSHSNGGSGGAGFGDGGQSDGDDSDADLGPEEEEMFVVAPSRPARPSGLSMVKS